MNKMDTKQAALETLKHHNQSPDTLIHIMKHNNTITFGNFIYKFKGVCRYYDLDAKLVSAPESEYVNIEIWRD